MKSGDTLVEPYTNFGDTLKEYTFILLYRYRGVVPGEAIIQLYNIPRRAVTDGELEPACIISRMRGFKITSKCTASHLFTSFSRCTTGDLDDGRRYCDVCF
jgi:hypothetical protein